MRSSSYTTLQAAKERIRHLTLAEKLALCLQLCEKIHPLHALRAPELPEQKEYFSHIHGNITPETVIISNDLQTITVLDLFVRAEKATFFTEPQAATQKISGYFPPERWHQSATQTRASDIYTLGQVFCCILTRTKDNRFANHLPYPPVYDNTRVTVYRHLEADLQLPDDRLTPNNQTVLLHFLLSMLDNTPENRPSTDTVYHFLRYTLKHYDTLSHQNTLQNSKIWQKYPYYKLPEKLKPWYPKTTRIIYEQRFILNFVYQKLQDLKLWEQYETALKTVFIHPPSQTPEGSKSPAKTAFPRSYQPQLIQLLLTTNLNQATLENYLNKLLHNQFPEQRLLLSTLQQCHSQGITNRDAKLWLTADSAQTKILINTQKVLKDPSVASFIRFTTQTDTNTESFFSSIAQLSLTEQYDILINFIKYFNANPLTQTVNPTWSPRTPVELLIDGLYQNTKALPQAYQQIRIELLHHYKAQAMGSLRTITALTDKTIDYLRMLKNPTNTLESHVKCVTELEEIKHIKTCLKHYKDWMTKTAGEERIRKIHFELTKRKLQIQAQTLPTIKHTKTIMVWRTPTARFPSKQTPLPNIKPTP